MEYKTWNQWLVEKKEEGGHFVPVDYEQYLANIRKAYEESTKKAAKGDKNHQTTLKYFSDHLAKLEGPGGKEYYANYIKKVK